jgi:REP element-mobilizing transposase RayT
MPDHVHAVVWLDDCSSRSLSSVSATAREIGQRLPSVAKPVWQRGFYDHVVRDEDDLFRIREYIATNPLRSPCRRHS